MKTLKLGELTLGEGMPKICIPLTGKTVEELVSEAEAAQQQPCQLVEWRADYYLAEMKGLSFAEVCSNVRNAMISIKAVLKVPMIFTIRRAKEGGQIKLENRTYYYLNQIAADTGMANVIDIEAFEAEGHVDEENIKTIIGYIKEKGCKVLLSNHDFYRTPDMEEMLTRYFVMQELDADIVKLAAMPQEESDVMNLLEVACLMRDKYAKVPFVAISMGELGLTTRVCGGEFGSVITFASGKNASAPGQMDATMLKGLLEQYYGE